MTVGRGLWKDLSYICASVALALTAACSADPSQDSRGPSPSPSPSLAAFVNGGDCPPAQEPLPADAGCVSRVVAGDEALSVYASVGADARPRSWHMRLETGQGEIDQPLHAGNAYSYPRALGASDIDRDGRQEWWVKVADFTSHGAPWSSANLFFERNGELIPIAFDGKPLGINYGGISRMGEGARCPTDRLVLLRAEAQNVRNTRWKTSERTFVVHDAKARFVDRREDLLTIEDYNDPDLDPYYRIDCKGFVYPS